MDKCYYGSLKDVNEVRKSSWEDWPHRLQNM